MKRTETSRRRARPCGGPHAFSLAEILIAIGILGIGLAMAASLFPAAIVENEESARNSLGMMVCEAGLGLAKAKLTYRQSGGQAYLCTGRGQEPVSAQLVDLSKPSLFDPAELVYPVGGNGRRGFFILARQVTDNKNDFQLVVVSYAKSLYDPNQPSMQTTAKLMTVDWRIVPGQVGGTLLRGQVAQDEAEVAAMFYRTTTGTPMVSKENGSAATVREKRQRQVEGKTVYTIRLDFSLTADDPTKVRAYVVVEQMPDGSLAPRSPGLTVLATRTALRVPEQ